MVPRAVHTALGKGGRAAVRGRGAAVVGEEQGLEGLGHFEDGSGQTGLLGLEAAQPRGLTFSLAAESGDGAGDGAGDGGGALRWSRPRTQPDGGDSLEEPPTGVDGGDTGSGSWVGFLGEEGVNIRFFFGAGATPFLDRVGVQVGEAAWRRPEGPADGADLPTEPESDEDEEDEEDMRVLTAARGSMSGGRGGGACPVELPW